MMEAGSPMRLITLSPARSLTAFRKLELSENWACATVGTMIPAANAANKVVRKKKTIAPNRPRMLCTLLICPEVIEFRFLAMHGWHCHDQSPSFSRSSRISPAVFFCAAGGYVVGCRCSAGGRLLYLSLVGTEFF